MTADVIDWNDVQPRQPDGPVPLDVKVETVMAGALEAKLRQLVVVGVDASGELYFASTQGVCAETLWLLALAQNRLLLMGDL